MCMLTCCAVGSLLCLLYVAFVRSVRPCAEKACRHRKHVLCLGQSYPGNKDNGTFIVKLVTCLFRMRVMANIGTESVMRAFILR